MVFGLLAILLATLVIFRLPVLDSLKLLVEGSLGDRFGWSRMAVKATPMLLTGIAMVVSWRAGMFNIGGEGQFIVGGLFGAAAAKVLVFGSSPAAPILATIAILGACIVGGAFWAWLAGLLFVRRGVDVVISTILLNFIATQILGYVVGGPLQESRHEVPLTDRLPDAVMLFRPWKQLDVHLGVPFAVVVAVVVYLYLFRTKAGFRLRLVGENDRVARANRIDSSKVRIQAISVSGALCGLAGGIEYLGMAGRLGAEFSQQWGFLGIPVALLSGLHPLTSIASSGLFGGLFAGSENLARFTSSGATLVYVIQAAAVLGYVGVKTISDRRKASPEAS